MKLLITVGPDINCHNRHYCCSLWFATLRTLTLQLKKDGLSSDNVYNQVEVLGKEEYFK